MCPKLSAFYIFHCVVHSTMNDNECYEKARNNCREKTVIFTCLLIIKFCRFLVWWIFCRFFGFVWFWGFFIPFAVATALFLIISKTCKTYSSKAEFLISARGEEQN